MKNSYVFGDGKMILKSGQNFTGKSVARRFRFSW